MMWPRTPAPARPNGRRTTIPSSKEIPAPRRGDMPPIDVMHTRHDSVRGRFRPWYAPSLEKASLRLGAQPMNATPNEKTTSGHNRSVLLPGLRQARQRSGLTQRELGELAGVGKGTVLELEVGRRGAYPRTARRLTNALATEVTDLI